MIDTVELVALYDRSFQTPLTEKGAAGLRALVKALDKDPAMADLRWKAYALATVKRECGTDYSPVCEAFWLPEEKRRALFAKYDGRRDLGNVRPGDGFRFCGRGYVQITGRRNYEVFQKRIGRPLIDQPDLALLPDVSYRILSDGMVNGLFTGHKLSQHIGGAKCDYRSARRIINGIDHAEEIARDAELFEVILKESTI